MISSDSSSLFLDTTKAEERLASKTQALDSSRRDYANPSQWWVIRNTKNNPNAQESKHKIAKESLWIRNSCRLEEQLQSAGVQVADSLEFGKFDGHTKEKVMRKATATDEAQDRECQQETPFPSYHQRAQIDYDACFAVSLVASLQTCAQQKDLFTGRNIHAQIIRQGLVDSSIYIGSTLVNLYAKCGELEKAAKVFSELHVWNVVAWNALIAGYVQHDHGEEALLYYEHMQREGFYPDAVTFVCVLKACGSVGALDQGQEIHAQIVRECLLEKNVVVANALVDMYVRCGMLAKACEVFNTLVIRNVATWNALISGYIEHGYNREALDLFEQMQAGDFSPDRITFACILKACGSLRALDKGQELHTQILESCYLKKDLKVGTALVDMYAKCGALSKAQEMFDQLPCRDVVSWNALITGYCEQRQAQKALACLEKMQCDGFSPNAVTFSCILKACSRIGEAKEGLRLHAEIVRQGLMEESLMVGSALVDLYANCGMLVEAHELFDKLPARNVVSWSSLMSGYAQAGEDDMVFDLFDKMLGEGTVPDSVTFTIVLNTCSHKGLLSKAEMYYEMLSKGYGITLTLEHHTCMIDLFSRVGYLDKAVAFLEQIKASADLRVWLAFMSACLKRRDIKVGRWAFEHAIRLDEEDCAAYVCMSNIYAACGRLQDAARIEALRLGKGAWKLP